MAVVLSSDMELKKSDSIDLEKNEACPCSSREGLVTASLYVTFMVLFGFLLREYSNQEFSAIITVGSMVQFFGYTLLLHKVRVHRSVAGLSARSLELYAVFYVFRLSSTMVKNGYIPVDASADWLYQALDIASLLTVLQLLFCMHKKHNDTYQASMDLPVGVHRAVLGSMLLAAFYHGNLNKSLFFDIMWMTSLYIDVVALLPQLWLMYQLPSIEALNAHYVAAIVLSRAMAFWFWFVGMPELAPKNGGPNVLGGVIVGAHGLQLLFSTEFMIKYLGAATKNVQEAMQVFDKEQPEKPVGQPHFC